jgi:hypothetical protein
MGKEETGQMPEGTRAPFIYMADGHSAAHEADFNRIYDTEHVPEILKVPATAGRALRLEKTNKEGMARYLQYDMDAANVMDSPAWLALGNRRLAPKIRPTPPTGRTP